MAMVVVEGRKVVTAESQDNGGSRKGKSYVAPFLKSPSHSTPHITCTEIRRLNSPVSPFHAPFLHRVRMSPAVPAGTSLTFRNASGRAVHLYSIFSCPKSAQIYSFYPLLCPASPNHLTSKEHPHPPSRQQRFPSLHNRFPFAPGRPSDQPSRGYRAPFFARVDGSKPS